MSAIETQSKVVQGKICPSGHTERYVSNGACAVCARKRSVISSARYQAANKEKVAQKNRNWKKANPDKIREYLRTYAARNPGRQREWRAANVDRTRAYVKKWADKNRDYLREKDRKYSTENPALIRAKAMLRHSVKLRRTPAWANREDLVSVYENCPPGLEVDHIVPLRGAIVSGLHVPWNLQYLPPLENVMKSNKFSSEWVCPR